jgi:hypothetical protein
MIKNIFFLSKFQNEYQVLVASPEPLVVGLDRVSVVELVEAQRALMGKPGGRVVLGLNLLSILSDFSTVVI